MKLSELIEEYKENSVKLHLEDDFAIKKKYIDKSNAIIKKVCKQKQEQEFFETLFLSNDPLILCDAAHDGFNCLYNIHKCLSILEYLKENADNFIFCSDPIKNEKIKDYCSNDKDIETYREEVLLYDSLNNDYLYRKFHEYFKLISNQTVWYYNQKNKKYKDESLNILKILNDLDNKNYLSIIFDTANAKFTKSKYNLNYLAINSYYACMFNYEKLKYRQTLADILKENPKDLTPNLINLVNNYLYEIDNSSEKTS